jgi:transposase
VANVLAKAKEDGIAWPLPEEMGDEQIYRLLWPSKMKRGGFAEPDWQTVQDELAKKHVTLNLLWQEYKDECIKAGKQYYRRSAFGQHYASWAQNHDVVMHIERRPGEALEVDWAGTRMQVYDPDECTPIFVDIFVACLPYSGYIYAEGCLDTREQAWLECHNHALFHLGGVPKSIVCDNLKVGVISRSKDGIVINESYRQLAEHYCCAVMPARPRKPRDKSSVEAAVGLVSRRAIAALRNEGFHTLTELNKALREKVDEINNAPFTRRQGSRKGIFDRVEKDALLPLPTCPFDVCKWEMATVQRNYHVSAGGSYYSVPVEYIKQFVKVRITSTTVEIYCNNERIATHPRSTDPHTFVTNTAHMPDNHKAWLSNDIEGLIQAADNIGPATAKVMRYLVESEQNTVKALGLCKRLINIARRNCSSEELLEFCCAKAMDVTSLPNISVDMIGYLGLVYGTDEEIEDDDEELGALLRGYGYFGDDDEDEDGDRDE